MLSNGPLRPSPRRSVRPLRAGRSARRGKAADAAKHEARRNQVRAVRRAAEAAHEVFANVGGNVARNSNPIQRFYRDMSVAMCHACNVDQPVYAAQAAYTLGKPIPPGIIV